MISPWGQGSFIRGSNVVEPEHPGSPGARSSERVIEPGARLMLCSLVVSVAVQTGSSLVRMSYLPIANVYKAQWSIVVSVAIKRLW